MFFMYMYVWSSVYVFFVVLFFVGVFYFCIFQCTLSSFDLPFFFRLHGVLACLLL